MFLKAEYEILGHLGARLALSEEVRNKQAKGNGVWVACLRAFMVAWRVSLRSPCATVDSQRTICIIIRTLQLQIKKEKIKHNRKNNQHVRVRGFLLAFHEYCSQTQVSFYLIKTSVISISIFKKCLL